MADKNIVILEGTARRVKFHKSTNGTEFCSLYLETNFFKNYIDINNVDETRQQNFINLLIFNNTGHNLVDYLKRENFCSGMRVNVIGYLSTYKREVKGMSIIVLNIVVMDISILLTNETKKKIMRSGQENSDKEIYVDKEEEDYE